MKIWSHPGDAIASVIALLSAVGADGNVPSRALEKIYMLNTWGLA